MAVYSLRYGYIFFANPQTASKAIARTLAKQVEGRVLHREISEDRKASLPKLHHLTYDLVVENGLLQKDQLDGLVRVTSVRNPYDLMVSRYLKHRERFTSEPDRYRWVRRPGRAGIRKSVAAATEKSFPDWLQSQYGDKPLTRAPHPYLDRADLVIRFESIQPDFDLLLQRIGVDWPVTVERENVTTQRRSGNAGEAKLRYADFYDDDSRALVKRLFEPVIDRFGYRFEH